jgi:hypothetical protein
MSWNYRILTKFVNYDTKFAEAIGREGERVFAIHSVYYTDDIAHSYSVNPINLSAISVGDLADTLQKVDVAMAKPILDIDNFPNEFSG